MGSSRDTSVVQHRNKMMCGSAKYTTVFPGTVSDVLGHHRVGVGFQFGTSEV